MLKDALDRHIHHISFHTPGHNGGVSVMPVSGSEPDRFSCAGSGAPHSIPLSYDVTELSFTDNLLMPTGVLADLERRAARAFGADAMFLFTNGATGAIFAAIAAVKGAIAVVGGAHVSVPRALSLMKREAVFFRDADALRAELDLTDLTLKKPYGAIFVTSPDYLGVTADLAQIRALADRAGAKLIVDAAHGSHFAFSSKLPEQATVYGDLVIYSLHKTLPVLTGAAALAVKSSEADAAFDARAATHTTSPSYPVLLSVEGFLQKSAAAERDYDRLIETIDYFKTDVERTPFRCDRNDDPTRLVLRSPFRADAVQSKLESMGVYPEYAFGNAVVLIATPYNMRYLAYCADCLKQIDGLSPADPDPVLTPPLRRAWRAPVENCEIVPLDRSLHRTLNAVVGVYPPGVPMYFPGDPIDAETLAFLQKFRPRIFGLARSGVSVVK